MKRYLLASISSILLVGFVMAEEFTLQITSIGDDGVVIGKKFFINKGGKGFSKAEEATVKLASNATVHKGKFESNAKGFTADGDDLKLAGLKAALLQAQNGSVLVGGKSITTKDSLELTIRDGKPSAKLNGKDIPFSDVSVKGKAPLSARVTTNDDGIATAVLLTSGGGGFGGGGFGGKKGKAKAD